MTDNSRYESDTKETSGKRNHSIRRNMIEQN